MGDGSSPPSYSPKWLLLRLLLLLLPDRIDLANDERGRLQCYGKKKRMVGWLQSKTAFLSSPLNNNSLSTRFVSNLCEFLWRPMFLLN